MCSIERKRVLKVVGVSTDATTKDETSKIWIRVKLKE